MSENINASVQALELFSLQLNKRNVSENFINRTCLERIIELAHSYTKPSERALVVLEVPLEEKGLLDVQFCMTEALKVPKLADRKLEACLDCCLASEGILAADFAFDATDNYNNEPCLYAYQPRYDAKATQSFFTVLGTPDYGKVICNAIEHAPKGWTSYYIGLMTRVEGTYARLGFGHSCRGQEYQQNVDYFIKDLRSIGYANPISDKMRQELQTAAQYGLLQDTQLSIAPDGLFLDKLGMDAVGKQAIGALALINDSKQRSFALEELQKCCFARKFPVFLDRKLKVFTLNSKINFVKCTWTKNEKSRLKAYLYLEAFTRDV